MKAKAFLTLALLNAALLVPSHGQRRSQRAAAENEPEVPMMRPEEAQAVQEQKNEFFTTLRPVAQTASQSTVWIWADTGRGRRPVGFGTVVGDGTKVLTKWSEISMSQGTILAVGHDSASAKATLTGVYQEEDLAVLKLEGAKFQPATFTKTEAPKLGRMLVAASPEEIPAGFGVVAVEARSLREKDQAFLGVGLDATYEGKGSGVRVKEVTKGSGAEEAGLATGDIILSVGGRSINSLYEMRTALTGHGPGERIEIRYKRQGKEQVIQALLKEKPEFEGIPNGRLRMMEKMGTSLSLVRNGFPSVIQTDMPLSRDRCGGPVVDLDGKVVGIAIARADRTRSFVIPAAHVMRMLEADPTSEEAARAAVAEKEREQQQAVARNNPQDGRPAPKMVPMKRQSADALRRNLEDMERLIDRMQEEMEGIEE